MKGDFSRRIFDATKHYAGVLHQQGRVWLDSDWNEEVFERLHLLWRETTDVVGICGVPEPGAAFLISPNVHATTSGDFSIGGGSGNLGRAYVDGILCQLEAATTYLTQPDLPVPPPITMPSDGSDLNAVVYLEVWQRLITALEDDILREVALGGPDTTARIKTVAQVRVAVVPQTSPATLLTCTNASQFLALPSGGTLTTLQPQFTQPAELCRLPDPSNFTGVENRLYRVEIHEGGDPVGSTDASVLVVPLAQDATAGATRLFLQHALTAPQIDAVTRWGMITVADRTGRSERAAIAGVGDDGQSITLTHGLTNAFTVASAASIHGVARFKWSRDNASFAVRVTAVSLDRRTLTLSSLGRDQATMLRQGDLVEICDDASELGPGGGHLTNLQSDPDPDQLTVVIADPLPLNFQASGTRADGPLTSPPPSPPPDRHLVLRRWDGQGTAQVAFSEIGTPDMDLGDGVRIQFGGANLLPGDYWQFTARSTDGSVEALSNAPPAGIIRHRCPLAVVSWSLHPPGSPPGSPPPSPPGYSLFRIEDCRRIFPPLVDLPRTEAGLHIQQVFTVNQASGQTVPLVNDSQIMVSTVISGINVACDANVDRASILRPTCFLTVEGAFSQSLGSPATPQLVGYNPVIVAGNVSAAGNIIRWLPSSAAAQFLTNLALASPAADRGILARFTLKGNFIWAQNNPGLFLDGEAFGFEQNGMTTLNLPSGDRRRGGDFEMWFWLIAQPVTLDSVVPSDASIFENGATRGTINLTGPATVGLVVQLTSTPANVVTIPATVPFDIGARSASFTIAAAPQVQADTQVTITATLGNVTKTTLLTVRHAPARIADNGLQVSPDVLTEGDTASGVVTLTAPAPAGASIALSSSNPNVASVPPSVSIGGAQSVPFEVTANSAGVATITAIFGNSATHQVRVVRKTGKENGEKGRVGGRVEKVQIEKLQAIEVVGPARTPLLMSGLTTETGLETLSQPNGRAFIRSDERPPIVPPG
jgi:hypothetical protein